MTSGGPDVSRTWQDGRWVTLARQSAAILGASHPAIVLAILCQWQCEQPNPAPWPPVHNNPGNLTRAIGTEDGEPHSLATSAPGAGLLYVYGTPEVGAAAYARYLLTSPRYPAAIRAARAGLAHDFLAAIDAGGYGTRLSCMLDLLAAAVLPPSTATAPRWRCAAAKVNIRSGPGLAYRVVGSVSGGQVVTGWMVAGGPYSSGGEVRTGWIMLSSGRYTAHTFYSPAD